MEPLIIEYLPSIIMTAIGLRLTWQDKKRTKLVEEQSDFFYQLAKCMRANNKGTIALAMAFKNDDKNGGLTSVMDSLSTADSEFENLLGRMATNRMAKR